MRALLLLALPGCFLFRNGEGDRCQAGRIVVLETQDDVARIAGCRTVTGLVVRSGATLDLAPLHELEAIQGDFVVGPTVGIEEVALNRVRTIDGAVRVSKNPSLRGLFLPRLEQAGRIFVEANGALTTIALPRIASIRGAMVISDNHSLELITAGELVTVGHELVVIDQPKLTLLELSKLTTVEAVRIERDPKLPPEMAAEIREKGSVP
ncbi:MAG: hypothetical protein ABI591_28650 [Kofleriaceae bacterium]